MSHYLRLSFRLLDAVFHGRGDGGAQEWPPSPLRAFQALVAAACNRFRKEQLFNDHARDPLEWLQGLGSPDVVAPAGQPSAGAYRLYVPNNHADVVAAEWYGGNRFASIAEHRVEKDVRPTRLSGGDTVYYLWPATPDRAEYARVLNEIARSVTHLGWGVDMAVADAEVITRDKADKLPGHRWRVAPSGGTPMRVPKTGTLDDLIRKHEDFLNRLSGDGFKPVPPLSCFDVVGYHSPTVPSAAPPDPRPVAAFEIHRTIDDQEANPGKSKFRPFHHVRRAAAVAGMVRHAAAKSARAVGWSEERVTAFVTGHGDGKNGQATSDDRLQFLPLPSLTPVGVGGIRRVLVVGPPGFDGIAQFRRTLNGAELIDEDTKKPVAMLSQIASTDREAQKFLAPGRVWSTVTPVILPGHEDPDGLRRKYRERVTAGGASADEQKHLLERLDARVRALLWKAFGQAGWTPDALTGAELEYRTVGWFRGLDLARSYALPPLDYPRYHVRVRFAAAVRGPVAVGAGRYRGYGLFAREGVE